MTAVLVVIAIIAYLASALIALRQLTPGKPQRQLLVTALAVLGLLAHGGLLFYLLQADQFDHLNIASSLSTVAWLLALLSTLRGNKAGSLLLRPVILLFAALSTLLLALAPVDWGANLDNKHGLVIHIVLSLVAYGVLALATLYALQLMYLNSVLKARKANVLANYLPPLLTVETYFFRLLTTGCVLLAFAIISGFAFLDNMLAQAQIHKTVLSILAFVIYAVVLIRHRWRGDRGKAVVITTVIAGFILTLAYFGSRFVKDILLS